MAPAVQGLNGGARGGGFAAGDAYVGSRILKYRQISKLVDGLIWQALSSIEIGRVLLLLWWQQVHELSDFGSDIRMYAYVTRWCEWSTKSCMNRGDDPGASVTCRLNGILVCWSPSFFFFLSSALRSQTYVVDRGLVRNERASQQMKRYPIHVDIYLTHVGDCVTRVRGKDCTLCG